MLACEKSKREEKNFLPKVFLVSFSLGIFKVKFKAAVKNAN
jgi:hypothetical protein